MAAVRVIRGEGGGTARVPPSKSYTHRALALALLASGESIVRNMLYSDDTRATLSMIQALGARVEEEGGTVVVEGGGPSWAPCIDAAESGTTMRIGVGIASLLDRPVLLYGRGRMHERPITPLLEALAGLGARYTASGCCPPVAVRGPIGPGATSIDSRASSQFLSSLLIASSRAGGPVEVEVRGLSSRGYIDVTLDVMEAYGVRVERDGYKWFRVEGPPRPAVYTVPGDWSSAAPLLAAAAIAGGGVDGVRSPDPQPDHAILGYLASMGARYTIGSGSVRVEPLVPHGFNANVDDHPDLAPTLAALAAYACGTSRICGVSRLRLKESDRVESILRLLSQARVKAWLEGECIAVEGRCGRLPRGLVLDGGGDHRIAMAAGILALAAGEGYVRGAESVNKSFPGFWSELEKLGHVVQRA